MNKSDRVRLGYTKDTMIIKCKLNGRMEMDEEQCYKHFRLYHNAEHGNCFTYNAKWNTPDHKVLYAYESDMWNKPTELILDLNIQTEEYLDDHKTPSVLIYVHDPRFYPDFGSEAVKARAGHFYSVGMRKTTTELLPLPYQTNCTKYSTMPWARRNKGVLTPKMCTQECSRMLQLKACRCVSSNLTLVYEDSPCEGKKAFCAEDVEKNTTDYCRTLCRVPCERKNFESSVDSTVWPRKKQVFNVPSLLNKNLTEIRKNLVRIKLYLRTMEITMYQHQPKYELVEVFSHLGGYLSLWLGFSVLAFCELLEMLSMVFLKVTDMKSTIHPAQRKPSRRLRAPRERMTTY
ncbi:degenerin unc-8-like [Parasteatoda tepidariorum]|uniref:degenerin unc-8-like n=1 Tax=Parasteatoda tepidariorum TaxID=114398 RepID=UPI0039BD3A28